jgi:fibronectin-binding autotransporter adhesin
MHTPSFGVKNELRARKLIRRCSWAAVLIAAFLCPTLVFGQTNSTWNGGTSNWSNATDWTPKKVPNNGGGNTYDVTIDSGGTDSVNLNLNANVNTLVLGGTTGSSKLQNLSGKSETLTIADGLTVNQTGALAFGNGSTLTVGGNATIVGSLDLEQASALTVSGNLTDSGTLTTNSAGSGGANKLTVMGTLTNNNVFNMGNPIVGGGDVANIGSLVNNSSMTLTETTMTVAGNVSNAFLDLEVMSTMTVGGNFTNSGLVETDFANVGGPTILTVMGTFTNQANAQFTLDYPLGASGDVANFGTLVNQGSIIIGPDATLNLTNQPNGITDVVAGSTLDLAGGYVMAGANNGLFKLNSIEGTLILENGININTATPSSGTLTVSKTGSLLLGFQNEQSTTSFNVSGNLMNAGMVDVETGSTLSISGNLTNSGIVEMCASQVGLCFGGETLTVGGAFTNASGAQLNIGPNDVAKIGTLTNAGIVIIGSGSTVTLTNQPNGITNIVAGSTLDLAGTLNAGANNGLFKLNTVAGNLILENGQTTTATPGSKPLTVSSTGSLLVSGPGSTTLSISGNLTNAGTIDLEEGSTLNISGNLSNSGTLTMNALGNGGSNTLTVEGTLTNQGNLNMDPGVLGSQNFLYVNHFVNNGTFVGGTSATVINVTSMVNNGFFQLGFNDTSSSVPSFGTFTNTSKGDVEIGDAANQTVEIGTLTNEGNIGVYGNGSGAPALEVGNIVNSGMITTSNVGKIQIGVGGNKSLNNKGLIAAENGVIQITGDNTTNTGTLEADGETLILDGGKVTNANGMILATNSGDVLLQNGIIVTGGTLSGTSGGLIETPSGETATLNGVTNSGAYMMADDSTTILSGKITNSGSISLNSAGNPTIAMIVPGGATLAGSGVLTLGTGGPNIIEGSNGKEFLTNSSTIQGAGSITNVGLINNGTILANAGTLAISPTVQLYGFTNNGSLIVDSGSAVNITGPVKLSFQTTGTVMVSSGATLTVGGSSAFTQTKGTTTVDGNLSAANGIFISGGILDGNAGTLTGNLSLAGATLSPGDGPMKVGELTVSGAYSQTSTSFLDIDLGGTTSGTFDVLNISGSASLHGTLNIAALTGFTPTVGEQFDILNYSSETGTFSTVDCTFSNGDGCSVTYNGSDAVLTITAPAAPAAKGTVSGAPATRVSRNMGTSAAEPVAILSRATCFATRLLGSGSCGVGSVAPVANGGEIHVASVGSGEVHNNVMVATHSMSVARGSGSHESSASAAAMARLYACAYLPASVGHTMGCN